MDCVYSICKEIIDCTVETKKCTLKKGNKKPEYLNKRRIKRKRKFKDKSVGESYKTTKRFCKKKIHRKVDKKKYEEFRRKKNWIREK